MRQIKLDSKILYMFFILDVGIDIAIAPLGGRSLWTITITIYLILRLVGGQVTGRGGDWTEDVDAHLVGLIASPS